MRAYKAPDDAWLVLDDGTNVYKITIEAFKAQVTGVEEEEEG